MKGAPYTVGVSFFAVIIGLMLGFVLAMMRMSGIRILRLISGVYIDIIRGTPMVVQALIFAYGVPQLLQKNGIPFSLESDYVACSANAEGGYQAAKQLLSKTPDLTAIFALKDTIALGAVRAICDMGLRVPEDFSVVGFDGVILTKYSVPRLSTIQQDITTLARKGVDDLLMRISYECSAVHERVPYLYVNGESVARPRE